MPKYIQRLATSNTHGGNIKKGDTGKGKRGYIHIMTCYNCGLLGPHCSTMSERKGNMKWGS